MATNQIKSSIKNFASGIMTVFKRIGIWVLIRNVQPLFFFTDDRTKAVRVRLVDLSRSHYRL